VCEYVCVCAARTHVHTDVCMHMYTCIDACMSIFYTYLLIPPRYTYTRHIG